MKFYGDYIYSNLEYNIMHGQHRYNYNIKGRLNGTFKRSITTNEILDLINDEQSTENLYDAKSSGYSFGTDLAEKELSTKNLHSNIDQFLNELLIDDSNLKCKNEG